MRLPSRANASVIAAAIVILFSFVYFFAFAKSDDPSLAKAQADKNIAIGLQDMERAAKFVHTNRCAKLAALSSLCYKRQQDCSELFSSRIHYKEQYNRDSDQGCSATGSLVSWLISKAYADEAQLVFGSSSSPPLNLPALDEVYDLDKLAEAVAVAETSGCTKGTGISKRNCFGIMKWPKVCDEKGECKIVRTARSYASHADSFADFKRVWQKSYGRFPDRALAVKWTGNDSPDTWLGIVCREYPHPSCA